MRRHVEDQIERQSKDSLGALALLAMWVLALMALSAAAHGQEIQAISDHIQPTSGRDIDSDQHILPSAPSTQRHPFKSLGVVATQSEQPTAGTDQVTLTRFILISIPDRQLALVDNGQVVKIYPIAVGARHTPSPDGNFTIISHVANPTWTHKGNVVGPGKSNPVGSRWMGLSLKGYGIHGTNAPRSIGRAASHGCFRMGKKDVEELFKLVRIGDTVAVRTQRDELVAQVFGDGDRSSEVQVASAAAPSVGVAQESENQ